MRKQKVDVINIRKSHLGLTAIVYSDGYAFAVRYAPGSVVTGEYQALKDAHQWIAELEAEIKALRHDSNYQSLRLGARPQWTGERLHLRYTDALDLTVLHHLPGSPGWSVRVVGNPDMGAYEWVIERAGKLEHSDCGYGDSDIALRDGLIAMHGMPEFQKKGHGHMKSFSEIQSAHDRLTAIVLGEVPCPFQDGPEILIPLLDVLCWVLEHDHNINFALNLGNIDKFLGQHGFVLEKRVLPAPAEMLAPVRVCKVCGCTDDRACPGGCEWVDTDLCSRCYEGLVQCVREGGLA